MQLGDATTRPRPQRRRWSGIALGLIPLAVLVAVNGLAIWGIINARSSARAGAHADLELQTRVHARSFEALLANLRADLVFLSQSPAIAELPTMGEGTDSMVRRWQRLNGEATLLLFFSTNPALERIAVYPLEGEPLVVAGLYRGAPQILPKERLEALGPIPPLLHGSWAVGSPQVGRLEAWVRPEALLRLAAPGREESLRLVRSQPTPGPQDDGTLQVAAPVVDDQWSPPVAWWLQYQEQDGQVLRSFEDLFRRYRRTLVLNVAVILLTLALAILADRQVRRAARLEAETEQQALIRALERQLMQSERLASVGRLAAGLAHEINNPLEGISNFLGVLEEDLRDGDLEGARRWTPKLRQGLNRTAAVTRQVLAFSDPAKAPKAPVDIIESLDETVDFVRSNPAFQSISIRWQRPAGTLLVQANGTALGQLFLNLLLNACEAQIESAFNGKIGQTGQNGQTGEASSVLEESAGLGEISVFLERGRGDSPKATIVVADRGPGFTPEALEHLFEPFYSGRGSSGLGLALCYGIVHELGGEIRASNRPQGGAEMCVELPMLEAETR